MSSRGLSLAWSAGALALAALLFAPDLARACGTPPPQPPPSLWVVNEGGSPREFWVGIEFDVFSSSGPMQCACGLGVGGSSVSQFPPASFAVTDVLFTRTPTFPPHPNFSNNFPTGTNLVAFGGMTLNAATGASLAGGSSLVNSTWSGFTALANTANVAPAGVNEVFKLWFRVQVNSADINSLNGLNFEVATGAVGDINHPISYYTTTSGSFIIPEPSSALLVGFGMIGLLVAARRVSRRP